MKPPRKPAQRVLRSQVEEWNRKYPVGTAVRVTLDSQAGVFDTTTRGPAAILSGHSAVILLNGITGVYKLDRVRAMQPNP